MAALSGQTSNVPTISVKGRIAFLFNQEGGLDGVPEGRKVLEVIDWLDHNGLSRFVVLPDMPGGGEGVVRHHIPKFLEDGARPLVGKEVVAETVSKDSRGIVLAFTPV